MARGDMTMGLKEHRAVLKLLDELTAYHLEGVEDGYGETEEERKKASFSHEEFDHLHETAVDPQDALQSACPQCGVLNRARVIKEKLQGARKAT